MRFKVIRGGVKIGKHLYKRGDVFESDVAWHIRRPGKYAPVGDVTSDVPIKGSAPEIIDVTALQETVDAAPVVEEEITTIRDDGELTTYDWDGWLAKIEVLQVGCGLEFPQGLVVTRPSVYTYTVGVGDVVEKNLRNTKSVLKYLRTRLE